MTAQFPRTAQIRAKIVAAVDHEARVGAMAATLRGAVRSAVRGSSRTKSPPTELERAVLDAAVRGHVQDLEKVPDLLDEIWSAAQAAQFGTEVRPILEFVEAYFFDKADLIPGHLGLVGLRDDAYVVLTLLQRVSLRHQELTGHELISANLSDVLARIKGLLAPNEISTLDGKMREATAHLDSIVESVIPHRITITPQRWSPSRSPSIDFKREMVRSQIRSDLAKGGIFL